jgi:hypothetical protein
MKNHYNLLIQQLLYLDFTIDNALGYLTKDSFLTQASTYGKVKDPKDLSKVFRYSDDQIIDGRLPPVRWENLTVEMNTDYPDMIAGYGYLHAPWNMHPSPYLSRFAFNFTTNTKTLIFPTYSSHNDILQYDNMMDFFYESALDPHGKDSYGT